MTQRSLADTLFNILKDRDLEISFSSQLIGGYSYITVTVNPSRPDGRGSSSMIRYNSDASLIYEVLERALSSPVRAYKASDHQA
jgi:hypothetical protein